MENKTSTSKTIERYHDKFIYINGEELLDFSSANFLGLRDDLRIKEEMKNGIDIYSLNPEINKTLMENTDVYFKLSEKLKKMTGFPEVIVYSSGYNVNVAIISALFKETDVIFSDSLNSINILEGVYLSGAKLVRYKHNDIKDLKDKIEKHKNEDGNVCVITDSIFTMNGEKAKLNEIGELKASFDFIFIVDETNANGILGENCGGVSDEQGAIPTIDMSLGYLYKVFGCMGEYAAMTTPMKRMLMQNSLRRDLINKSTINPIMATGALKALELAEEERWRRSKVVELCTYLNEELTVLGFNLTLSESGILTIVFETDREVIDISKLLYEDKILAAVTISKTTIKPRIRFFIGAHFEKKDMEKVVNRFKTISQQYYTDNNPISIK